MNSSAPCVPKCSTACGPEVFAQPAVERRESVRGCEALLEQQAHRVAFVAERRLHADEDVAEAFAIDEEAELPSLCCLPGAGPHCASISFRCFSRRTWSSASDAHMHVGMGTQACAALPLMILLAQRHRRSLGHGRRCSPRVHRAQRVEQRLEHRQECGRARVAGVRREVEDDGGDLALGARPTGADRPACPTRAASRSARSMQLCMSCCIGLIAHRVMFLNVQRCAQPVHSMCSALPRPPKTIEPVAPSSSGMATIMVASTGSRPRGDAPHWSSVWNSTGVTAR